MADRTRSRGVMRWLTPEIAITALILVLLVVVGFTWNQYGFTTDELNGLTRARNIVAYLASGWQDPGELTAIRPENFYGAMADVLALLLQKLVPALGLDARHLVSSLFGVAGVYYTYRLGKHLGSGWVGVVAAAFLALTPMWVGYMFLNLKDIPFGTAMLAASYYGLKVMGEARRPSWTTMVGLAIWCGALGTSKLTGILLLGFSVLVLLGFWLLQHGWLPLKTLALRALLCAGLGIAGVALFAIAFWPQLYLYPPDQVFRAVVKFLDYDAWRGTVLINGEFFDQDHVPRHYLVTHLLITMPLFALALYLISAPVSLIAKRYAVLGAIVLPMLFVAIQAITDAQVYNGYRQFLFTVPFICVGCGYALVTLAGIGGSVKWRLAGIGAFAAFAAWMIFVMASLYPYQYSTYNWLVGGTAGAEDRYAIDSWRSAQREAMKLIDNQIPAGVDSVSVYACGSELNFNSFPRLKRVGDPKKPSDFTIRLPRCSLTNPPGFEVVGEVRRGGVLFASVLWAPKTVGLPVNAPGQVPPHP